MSEPASRRLPFQTLRAQAAAQPLVVDTLLALALSALSIFTLMAGARDLGQVDPLNVTLLLLQTLPLAVRRRWPVAVFLVTFGALVVQILVIQNGFSAPLGSFIALYTVGQRVDRTRSGLLVAGAALVFLLVMIEKNALPASIAGVIQSELALFVVWTLGVWSRERQAYVGQVEERAARLEREREERDARAVADERERIARELHDMVTHHVSVIVIQAGAALRALDRRPEEARTAVAAIDSTARQALADMRRMLGILATPAAVEGMVGAGDATTDPLAPMPGLDRLGELLEAVRATGLPVELTIEGERRPLDPGIELSAYRIIQEALTNVMKHARGATATVRVRYTVATLEIEVTDRGGSGGRGIGVPGTGGRGLIGMRERVAVFGGRFEAGPVSGGFRVAASLPIGAAIAAASPVGA